MIDAPLTPVSIQIPRVSKPLPDVNIAVTPDTGVTVSITNNSSGATYTWTGAKYHLSLTSLTFTGTVTNLASGVTIVGYTWRFGDGIQVTQVTSSTSTSTTHTYKVASPTTSCTLAVLLSDGTQAFATKAMNLQPFVYTPRSLTMSLSETLTTIDTSVLAPHFTSQLGIQRSQEGNIIL